MIEEVKMSKEKKVLKASGKTVGHLSVTHQWIVWKTDEEKASGPPALPPVDRQGRY